MIIARIKGGLGNQLFIYAAARRLAIKNKTKLILDDVSGFAYDDKFNRHYQLDNFNITCQKATAAQRLEPFSRIRRYLKRYINSKKPYQQRSYINQYDMSFDPKFLQLRNSKTLYLEGYWQSEKYFKDVENIIREDLKFKIPKDNENTEFLRNIQNKNSIAIHFRNFDKPNKRNSNANLFNYISIDYYKRSIKYINSKISEPHYFIFSDDPKAVSENLQLDIKNFSVVDINQEKEKNYADLWLMSNCKHFITTNSTFSWWGAWLAKNKKKIVITPDFKKKQRIMK